MLPPDQQLRGGAAIPLLRQASPCAWPPMRIQRKWGQLLPVLLPRFRPPLAASTAPGTTTCCRANTPLLIPAPAPLGHTEDVEDSQYFRQRRDRNRRRGVSPGPADHEDGPQVREEGEWGGGMG